jgi:hypothetical protein
MLCLRKLRDVGPSILQCYELSAAGRGIGSSKWRRQLLSGIFLYTLPIGPHLSSAPAASLAGKPRLKIGQAEVSRLSSGCNDSRWRQSDFRCWISVSFRWMPVFPSNPKFAPEGAAK